jgi:hypothetical protein
LIAQSTFANHPFARKAITDACEGILNDRFYSTSDQVENCIKPFKYEIDVEDSEWSKGRVNVAGVLKRELGAVEDAIKEVEKSVGGRRKLKDVVTFVEKAKKGEVDVVGDGASGAGGFSSELLQKGRLCQLLK